MHFYMVDPENEKEEEKKLEERTEKKALNAEKKLELEDGVKEPKKINIKNFILFNIKWIKILKNK